jgi:hypothetical protein
MKEYTPEDIHVTPVEYERREWWPACPRLGREVSEFRYFKAQALCFTTKDGLYTTGKPNSDDMSYWHESSDPNGRLGNIATDYVFGCTGGLESAVKKLNEITRRYNLCQTSTA